jgi:hypothetical protein
LPIGLDFTAPVICHPAHLRPDEHPARDAAHGSPVARQARRAHSLALRDGAELPGT